MINCKKWDIILVPFPFTDLSRIKKRPALVVSPNEYNTSNDIVIAFITSNLKLPPRLFDYKIVEWKKAKLPKPSIVRMKFATISKSIVVKKLGRLTSKDRNGITKILNSFFCAE